MGLVGSEMCIRASNNEIARNDGDNSDSPGIVSIEGLDVQKIYVPSAGQIRVDLLVYGTGLDYNPKYAGIGSAIIEILSLIHI